MTLASASEAWVGTAEGWVARARQDLQRGDLVAAKVHAWYAASKAFDVRDARNPFVAAAEPVLHDAWDFFWNCRANPHGTPRDVKPRRRIVTTSAAYAEQCGAEVQL